MLSMLVGHPDDSNWMQDVVDPAASVFDEIRVEGDSCDAWSTKQRDARRGDFISITTGVSYGGGQLVRLLSGLSYRSLIHGDLSSDQETSSSKNHAKFRS